MRLIMMCLIVLSIIASAELAAAEQKGPMATVVEGCKTEIEAHCKNVTRGEGRLLACLYAYEDKLSNRCEYALYDAVEQLERAVTALTYAVNECRTDLKSYCSNIQPGEGRLMACLDKNGQKVSARCKKALKDVGLKK
jgi:hypothetical protein